MAITVVIKMKSMQICNQINGSFDNFACLCHNIGTVLNLDTYVMVSRLCPLHGQYVNCTTLMNTPSTTHQYRTIS